MKENEAALLEASRGSGKKPEGPDVKPPEAGMQPEKPPEGAPPAGRGEEVRKRIEELLKTTTEKGGAIPKEIEELIKMILTRCRRIRIRSPTTTRGRTRGQAQAARPEAAGRPGPCARTSEDPAKKPYTSDDKPPEGDWAIREARPLPWIVGPPPEQQRQIMNGDTKDAPPSTPSSSAISSG